MFRLFAPRTVAQAIAALQTAIDDLYAIGAQQAGVATDKLQLIDNLRLQYAAHCHEADQATRLAANLAGLIAPEKTAA